MNDIEVFLEEFFEEMFATSSILLIFISVAILILAIFLWILSSLGIMNLAKKNGLKNPWLAFLPCGNIYLIAKMGFEIYANEEKRNSDLTWIALGLSIGTVVLSNRSYSELINLASLVFNCIAFYNIFKKIHKNYVVFTVFTALTNASLGGVFLYFLTDNHEVPQGETNNQEKEDIKKIVEENKETKKNNKKEIPNFCSNCGRKLEKNNKYCGTCGKKLN